MYKSGWKTTELLVVVVTAALSVLIAMGYVTPDQAAEIESALVETIDAVTRLVGALSPIVGAVVYVWSRTKVKTSKYK